MLNSVESPGRPSPLSAAVEPVAVCVIVTFATLVGVSLMSGGGTGGAGAGLGVTTERGQSLPTAPGLAMATIRSPTWKPPADCTWYGSSAAASKLNMEGVESVVATLYVTTNESGVLAAPPSVIRTGMGRNDVAML